MIKACSSVILYKTQFILILVLKTFGVRESSIYLYWEKKYDTYKRSFTKIQEVVAAIEGFSKLFYLCFFYYIIL